MKTQLFLHLLLGTLLFPVIYAQDPFKKGEDSLAVENVRIESMRVQEKPELNLPQPDNKFVKPDLNFKDRFAPLQFALPQASVLIPPPLTSPLQDYSSRSFRVGGGRFATTVADFSWHNGRNKHVGWGIDAHHRGMAKGFQPYAEFLSHQVNGHLNWYKNRFVLGVVSEFNQADYHHYGDPLLAIVLDQQLRTRRNWVRMNSAVSLKSNDPGANTSYLGEIRFRIWNDNLQSQETNVSLKAEIDSRLKDNLCIQVAYEGILGNYRYTSLSQGSFFNHLKPVLRWKKDRADLKGGLGLNVYSAQIQQTAVYPYLLARYELLKDRMEVGGELTGGMQYQMIFNWIQENPYLDTLSTVLPALDKYRAGVYVSGKWAKILSWKVSAYTRKTDRQAVYYSMPDRKGYFTVLYDTGFVQNGVRLDFQLNQMKDFEAGGSIIYNDNQTGTVAKFFHQPAFRSEFFLSWWPVSKLKLTLRNYTFGRRYMGLDPALSPDALVQAPAFSDLGIGAEYRFYKRFSLFLEANNLAAQSYERWYSYPERPLDFRGGLSVVF